MWIVRVTDWNPWSEMNQPKPGRCTHFFPRIQSPVPAHSQVTVLISLDPASEGATMGG